MSKEPIIEQLQSAYAATEAKLKASIEVAISTGAAADLVRALENQHRRGRRMGDEGRSASGTFVMSDGNTIGEYLPDIALGSRLRQTAITGAHLTNTAGTERHQQLIDWIRPHLLDLLKTDPKIKNSQIIEHLLEQHKDLCQFERADGSTKSYAFSTLEKAVRKIRKES